MFQCLFRPASSLNFRRFSHISYFCRMNPDHQNICIQCGLCCDGTLFHHARIQANEPLETEYSFETIVRRKPAFRLPCNYLKDKVCSIYDRRPYSICANFQCKLLRAVRSGNTTPAGALKIINEVIDMKTNIESQILEHHPENTGDSLPRKLKEFQLHFAHTMSEVETRRKFGQLFLSYFMLKKKLSDSFMRNQAI